MVSLQKNKLYLGINERKMMTEMTTIMIIGLLLPLLGTMFGSAFVFLMKDEMSVRLQKSLLGFASGVMVAASVWSLLIPAMEMEADSGKWAVVPAAVGFLLGIAIQNIPEGAIISMPMRAAGNSRWRSFMLGSLSGVVEPIGAVAVIALATLLTPALPYLLAFAAGAMFYVVVEELIPEASSGQHSNLSTIGFAIGFVLMMVLDVVMG